jgi:hypothetical protein
MQPRSSTHTVAAQLVPRFDIADRKGLEIVLLTALFTFSDLNENYHAASEGRPGNPRRKSSGAPPVPPKPEPRVGVERIAEMQAYQGEVNELVVEDEGEIEDYAAHGWNLLEVRRLTRGFDGPGLIIR